MAPYPSYLIDLVHTLKDQKKVAHEDKEDVYQKFLETYINAKVFKPVEGQTRIGYEKVKKAFYETDDFFLNQLAEAAGELGLIPQIPYKNFLEKFYTSLLATYPVLTKTGQLTKEAQALLERPLEYSWKPPLIHNKPVLNGIAVLFKALEKEPLNFNPYWGDKVRSIIASNLECSEKYGYPKINRSDEEENRLIEYPTISYEAFLEKYKEYFVFTTSGVVSDYNVRLKPKMKKIGIIYSAVTGVVGIGAGILVGPEAFLTMLSASGGLAVTSGLATGFCSGLKYRSPGEGWLSLTPAGRKLLRELKAWENYVDKVSDEAKYQNSFPGVQRKTARIEAGLGGIRLKNIYFRQND